MKARAFLEYAIPYAIAASLALAATAATAQDRLLRMGDQRGNARAVMEAAGVLKDLPYRIEWREFPNSAPLFEALAADAIDAGPAGAAPLTFAAANGLKAKGIDASRYVGDAVVVRNDSPFRTLPDLAGRKVAVVKGGSGHATLLRALKQAGLRPDSVQPVFLPPAEMTLALNGGSVDAMVASEPYVSFAILKSNDRILVDGKDFPGLSLIVASEKAIAEKRELLKDFVARHATARAWGIDHAGEYSRIIANLLKMPEDIAFSKQRREVMAPQPIDAEVHALQQMFIDLYFDNGLIARKIEAGTILDDRFVPKP